MNYKLLSAALIMCLFSGSLSSIPNVSAQDETESLFGLTKPVIVINKTEFYPGEKVEITVQYMPEIPSDMDPRLELYMYLPFLEQVGKNVPLNCLGEHCVAVYSFDEIRLGKTSPKTISFVLFSKENPKPIVLDGWLNSVCDLKYNGKTIERYGNTCNSFDLPLGIYEIKFAWGIEIADKFEIFKTIPITITEPSEKQQETQTETSEKSLGEDILEKGANMTKDAIDVGSDIGKEAVDKGTEVGKAVIEKGTEVGQEVVQKGTEVGETVIEKGTEVGQEAVQKGTEIGEIVIEKGSEAGQTVVEKSSEAAQEISDTTTDVGGCLIATATFGSELSQQVQQLRELRDSKLIQTDSGASFMNAFNQFYYFVSPTISDWQRENPVFKNLVKVTITPMISSLSLLNYVEMDSENQVLSYGISVILLNIGIYFVSPALVIWKVKNRFFSKVNHK